jgi:hypothetical protein
MALSSFLSASSLDCARIVQHLAPHSFNFRDALDTRQSPGKPLSEPEVWRMLWCAGLS